MAVKRTQRRRTYRKKRTNNKNRKRTNNKNRKRTNKKNRKNTMRGGMDLFESDAGKRRDAKAAQKKEAKAAARASTRAADKAAMKEAETTQAAATSLSAMQKQSDDLSDWAEEQEEALQKKKSSKKAGKSGKSRKSGKSQGPAAESLTAIDTKDKLLEAVRNTMSKDYNLEFSSKEEKKLKRYIRRLEQWPSGELGAEINRIQSEIGYLGEEDEDTDLFDDDQLVHLLEHGGAPASDAPHTDALFQTLGSLEHAIDWGQMK